MEKVASALSMERIVMGVATVLLAAGVVGLWDMSRNVARLEERVSGWTRIFEDRFEGLEARHSRQFDKVDREIDGLRGLIVAPTR